MIYLKRLEIENVRCFGKKQHIDFTTDDNNISQWTVILGDNGTGKTSLLKSIVSLLPSPQSFLSKRHPDDTDYVLSINNEWRNSWDLRHKNGEENSTLTLRVVECEQEFGKKIELEIPLIHKVIHNGRSSENLYIQQSNYNTKILSPVYCFAYGANRKMAEKSLSDESFTNTNETLFRESALLQNSSEYLLRIDYETAKKRKGNEEKNRVKDLLLKVLPAGVKDIKVVKSGKLQREVMVETDFGWVKLSELSLGYKTTIAWVVDFASKMMYYHEKSKNPFAEPAILIIDEIDLHMHPSWQRDIIDSLTKLFPKTQFIVTAHSPLIAQAALGSRLILLKQNGDHVEVENNPDIIKSWRIDQVLTSDLFGLKESRAKDIEGAINRRRTLLKKIPLNPSEKQELKALNQQIYSMPVGETKAEIDAMEILRDFAKKLEEVKKKK